MEDAGMLNNHHQNLSTVHNKLMKEERSSEANLLCSKYTVAFGLL
jgi:hypothetical protein